MIIVISIIVKVLLTNILGFHIVSSFIWLPFHLLLSQIKGLNLPELCNVCFKIFFFFLLYKNVFQNWSTSCERQISFAWKLTLNRLCDEEEMNKLINECIYINKIHIHKHKNRGEPIICQWQSMTMTAAGSPHHTAGKEQLAQLLSLCSFD